MSANRFKNEVDAEDFKKALVNTFWLFLVGFAWGAFVLLILFHNHLFKH